MFAFLISILFSSLLIYSFTLRFAQVHNNLLHRILYGLDGATLAAASAVCTPWRDALALPSVWRDILALQHRALPAGYAPADQDVSCASTRAALLANWRRASKQKQEYVTLALAIASEQRRKRDARRAELGVGSTAARPGALTLIRT